ncbi:uncharacterized protein [Diadema antillarum]|uniref:uncharacterized protein n=1 Tax=Diadema antillarum TaxID=105358 RepID=UPI003A882336
MALLQQENEQETCPPAFGMICGTRTVTLGNGETVAMVPKLMTEDEIARAGNHPMLKGKTRFTCRNPGLGRDGNKRTIIDRLNVRKMEKPLFSDSVGRLSGPHVYDRFWLNFDSGNFSVGRYGNPEPFFNWLDPNPLEFRSIGLMTWWGSTGRWKFHSFC